jgi:hypothetical protein
MNKNPIIIIGYSGHAWVAIDAFQQAGGQVVGYCEREEKKVNPYKLPFLGSEDILKEDQDQAYFVGIGNNTIRKSVMLKMHRRASIIVHPTAVVATLAKVHVFTPDCKFISQDTRHLTKPGAVYLGELVAPQLEEILYNEPEVQ